MDPGGVATHIGLKLALAVVIGMASVAGLRYLQAPTRRGWRRGKRAVQVLETVALGQQRAVHLVSVAGRRFLIASTQNQVAMLADVGPAEGEESADSDPPANAFGAALSRLLRPPDPPQAGAAAQLHAAASQLRARASEAVGP